MEDQKDLPPTQPIENNELPDDINHDAVQPPKPKSKKKWLWIGLAAVLIAAGLGYWFFVREDEAQASINSYDECVAAGYPVMESYPEQCAVPGGQTFTRQLSEEEQIALDEAQDEDVSLTPQQAQQALDGFISYKVPIGWGEMECHALDSAGILLSPNNDKAKDCSDRTNTILLGMILTDSIHEVECNTDPALLELLEKQKGITEYECNTVQLAHTLAVKTRHNQADGTRLMSFDLYEKGDEKSVVYVTYYSNQQGELTYQEESEAFVNDISFRDD